MKKIIILLLLLSLRFTGNGGLAFVQDLSYESDIEYILTNYYILGDYENVIRLLNKYHSDNKESKDGLAYLYGLCYLKLSMNKLAIDYFNVALAEHENNYEILNNIGVAYFQDGDYITAMKYFHLSFISNLDYEIAQKNYNAAYENWSSQRDNYRVSTIIPFTEKPTMYNSLGWFYYYLGDFHNAIYYFEKSIDEDAKYQFSYIALAYIYHEGNNFETALHYLKEAEKINRFNPDIYNNMGIIYFHLSDLENSEKAFKKAISLNKRFAEPYNNLGFLYFEADKYVLAEEYFEKSIEFNINDQILKAESVAGIAIISFINKNIDKSKTYKETSIKLNYKMNDIKYLTDQLKWTPKLIDIWVKIN